MESDGDRSRPPEGGEAVAKAISSTLVSVLEGLESRAAAVSEGQENLCRSLDRLAAELDRLLEEAPPPLAASKVLSVQNRIHALNSVLCSIQRRIDDMDRIIAAREIQPRPSVSS